MVVGSMSRFDKVMKDTGAEGDPINGVDELLAVGGLGYGEHDPVWGVLELSVAPADIEDPRLGYLAIGTLDCETGLDASETNAATLKAEPSWRRVVAGEPWVLDL